MVIQGIYDCDVLSARTNTRLTCNFQYALYHFPDFHFHHPYPLITDRSVVVVQSPHLSVFFSKLQKYKE